MINVRNTLRGGSSEVNINMGPLVDMVFLLLIFFVVTTSFVKETGIDVQRSTAATAEVKERGNIMLGVSAEGRSTSRASASTCAACAPWSSAPWPRIPKAAW